MTDGRYKAMRHQGNANGLRLRSRARQGFTFLEIIVVVAILGILAAIVIPNMMGGIEDSKLTQTRVNISGLKQALEMYKIDNNRYPTTEQGLKALVTKPTTDPTPVKWKQYMPEIPLDGWQKEFTYICPGTKSPFEIRSAGPDGQLDTADDVRSTDPANGSASGQPRNN